MGTKVQHKIHMPYHFPVRDLNEEPTSSWTLYHQDEQFTVHPYDNIKPYPVNGHVGYDKEMLRRTMLEHEDIFQKQVYELHRLYRIQKDLMVELHKNQLLRLSAPMNVYGSSIVSSQMPPHSAKGIWQVHNSSEIDNHRHDVNIASCDDKNKRVTTNLRMEGLLKDNHFSGDNWESLKDSRCKTGSKRTFDLHLPAEAYIEVDDSEKLEKEKGVKFDLSRATMCSHGTIDRKPDIDRQGSEPAYILTDLNEPIKDPLSDEEGFSLQNSDGFIARFQNIQEHQDMRAPSTGYLHNEILGRPREKGSSSGNTNQAKSEIRQDLPVRHLDSDQNKNVIYPFGFGSSTKYPMSSEAIQLKLMEKPTCYLPDKEKRDHRPGLNSKQPFDLSRSLDHVDSYISGSSTIRAMNSQSVVSLEAYQTTCKKLSRKVEHIPIAVQALPCFSSSTLMNGRIRSQNAVVQNKNSGFHKQQPNGDLGVTLRTSGKPSSQVNSLHHNLYLEHNSSNTRAARITIDEENFNMLDVNLCNEKSESNGPIRYRKGLNLNTPTNEQQNDVDFQNDMSLNFSVSNDKMWMEKLPGSSNVVGQPQHQIDLGFTKSFTQLISIFDKAVPESATKDKKENDLHFQVVGDHIDGVSCIGSRNGSTGYLLADNNLQSSNSSKYLSFQEHSLTSNDPRYTNEQMGVDTGSIRFRNDVKLSSSLVPNNNDVKSAGTYKGGEDFPSCSRKNPAKRARVIDLEAPADELEDENKTADEFTEINQQKKTVNFEQEREFPSDISTRVAAYTIFSLSKDACNSSDAVRSHPESAVGDSLHWFAELVVSKGRKETDSQVSDDELDLFESMTLKLEEVQDDCYWHKSCAIQKPNDGDEKCATSLLFTRPRRGQARKRRQQKNFQKDVLPTISLLSKHEVSEDLQAFGGFMKTLVKG